MPSVTYFAFDDNESGKLNLCSREISDRPLGVNAAGYMNIEYVFTTDNRHTRLDYYLMYVTSGRLLVKINGKEVFAEAGDVILFPPQYRYRYSFAGGGTLSYYFVHFSGSYTEELLKQLSLSDLPGVWHVGHSEKAVGVFAALFDAFAEGDPLRDLRAAVSLEQILIALSSERFRSEREAPLGRSLSYIKAFYTRSIRIPELAASEGLSVSRYNTLFKQQTGMSPIRYITQLRMKHAASLLLATDLDVRTVGEIVGYEDNHFFSKVFKKQMGCSPLTYRKSALKPQQN